MTRTGGILAQFGLCFWKIAERSNYFCASYDQKDGALIATFHGSNSVCFQIVTCTRCKNRRPSFWVGERVKSWGVWSANAKEYCKREQDESELHFRCLPYLLLRTQLSRETLLGARDKGNEGNGRDTGSFGSQWPFELKFWAVWGYFLIRETD